MTRCAYCFRYWVGEPLHCPRCNRSFDQRICSRGHVSACTAKSCETCGSSQLSVPAPVNRPLNKVALWTVRLAVGVTLVLFAFILNVGLLVPLDWVHLRPRLLLLLAMPWLLYRATLVLRGPIVKARRPQLLSPNVRSQDE